MRNAERLKAASTAAPVHKHEVLRFGHGRHAYLAYLGGSGGEYRLLEVPFCEYVMRGSTPPHPALLVFSSKERTYAITVNISIVRILEAPGVNIPYLRSHFASA
jgi:hypothetical protein